MSKIRELMKEVAEKHMHEGLWEFHSQTTFEDFSKELEQAIKAEIMGLKTIKYLGNGSTSANGKYNDNFHPMTLVSADAQHIKRSDLENLFKESE